MDKTGVIITDDHKLFRKGIIALFNDLDFVEVVGEAGNGKELLDLLSRESSRTGVVLLDLQMPVMDGPTTLVKLKELYPDIKVIILTMDDDEQMIAHLIHEGVNGYILKSADTDEMEIALRKVIQQDFYFSNSISEIVMKGLFFCNTEKTIPDIQLTERESEVLNLICEELTAVEIGERLFLSVRTIEGYRARLLEKTGSRNSAGLVLYAIKNQLVNL
ncbi:MAG: DNA-binding response regulator [Draconibacterium sp.]|nr:MAG: DNA-binding response regulator [Draconibacterium sp.]PIF06747.1 MAG: DNA-binding response regulator [Draconibacterium sp.]